MLVKIQFCAINFNKKEYQNFLINFHVVCDTIMYSCLLLSKLNLALLDEVNEVIKKKNFWPFKDVLF